jgi:nucleoside-diphosphate-sugar epimerase
MNIGVTLACYAAICVATGRPFVFPGSQTQHSCLTDITDARLLARHLAWAATTPAARNEAFNVVNGDIFRWKRLWTALTHYFGLEPSAYDGAPTSLQQLLTDAAPTWNDIVARHHLQPNPLDRLASGWHTDADLGRPIECVNDMSKSRRLGFQQIQDSQQSFFDLFDQLRQERVIP